MTWRGVVWLAVLALCGCQHPSVPVAATPAPPPSPSVQATPEPFSRFFQDLLKQHHEKDIVIDAHGVGLARSPVRFRCEVVALEPGDTVIAQLKFTVLLPDQREVVDLASGMGSNTAEAVQQALENFCYTVFHPIYKTWLDPADPHEESRPVKIHGLAFQCAGGNLISRGTETVDLKKMPPQIDRLVAKLPLDARTHWVKVVYSQVEGRPKFVEVYLDNQLDPKLTEAVTRLPWPRTSGVYYAREFLMLRPVPAKR